MDPIISSLLFLAAFGAILILFLYFKGGFAHKKEKVQ